MAAVKAVINDKHYVTYLSAGSNLLTADEHPENGGTGAGFNPSELLCSSLAACTCITLRMYADRKEFPLEKIETDVTLTTDNQSEIHIARIITLTGALTEEQRSRLLEIANKCPIHKILSKANNIQTTLG